MRNLKNEKNQKNEKTEKNESGKTWNIDNRLTEKELKDLFNWFNGKPL
jgi:hypothetical protein